MTKIEKRKDRRVKILNCVSYICLNSTNKPSIPQMGFVRNVSQGGVCIDTVCRINTESVLLMFIDMENNPIEIKGKVAYCQNPGSGMFKAGIRFEGTEFDNRRFVKNLVRSYHYQKRTSCLVDSKTAYSNRVSS